MKKLGAGRESQVFDLGEGRVLRHGGFPEREAAVMAHARAAGYPVPKVLEIRDDALVLELVEGPTMLADLGRRPWRLRAHARALASLHRDLHGVDYEDGRLLHFDLHPENVILGSSGPVVIDWTNARSGDPAVDVALTWLIARTSGGLGGRLFSHPFLACFDRADIERALPEAAAFRLADPNVRAEERAAVRALLANRCGGAARAR